MAFEKALKILEYDKILKMLSDCAKTDGAKEKAQALFPSDDIEKVRFLNRQTTDSKKYMQIKGMPPFGGIKDITSSVDRADKGAVLSARELLDIANVLRTARALIEYAKTDMIGETSIDVNFERLYDNKRLEDKIYRAIHSEDVISDEASPALADIRRKIKNTNNRIKDTLQKYTNSPSYSKFLQENIVTIRNGRYVVPVKTEYKNEIKGLVHDTSSSGSTLFIEPMPIVDANNELRELESKEKAEIERILAELSSDCSAYSDCLVLNYVNITELALIFAKGELSVRFDATEPEINSEKRYELVKARHPLLNKDTVVPVSVSLGRDFDTLVITGPNTGGKTVSLKTLGLLALMAQSGLHIPASEASTVCVFTDIHADIGDEQSIEQSLSTFSSHMVNIIEITKSVTENSLVLFDELGAGTDPVEGAALAIAVLEYIRGKGALCASTTHYAELKAYALETEGVSNGACEFDVSTLKPTYRLIIGAPGKSNAFEISAKLGLDGSIVENARELVSKENKNFEEVIGKLNKSRLEMEESRQKTDELRREFEEYKKITEAKIALSEERAAKELKKAQEQAARIIANARVTSEFVLDQIEEAKKKKDSQDAKQKLEEARNIIRNRLKNADDEVNPVIEREIDKNYVLPRPLKVGDEVLIVSINKVGIVTKLPNAGDSVEIQAGSLKTRTHISNLVLTQGAKAIEAKKKKATGAAIAGLRRDFNATLDLRGMTGDDAWFTIDKYFDEAKMVSVNIVTLLHGKGTGALRGAIWRELKSDKRVASFRAGKYGEGDYGVTVVELK